jgi:2,5-diketo-D-gluconate reductase A
MTTPTFKLNDGNDIPSFGFGTFQIPADGSTYNTVKLALADGYRHIDTAVAYFNEQEVGKAIKDSGIPRAQIWVSRFKIRQFTIITFLLKYLYIMRKHAF